MRWTPKVPRRRAGLNPDPLERPALRSDLSLGMPRSNLLEELSWTDVEARIAAGTRTVIIMTASMEQHGPHLPTMTDTAIGYAVGARVAERLGDALLAPVIRPGCSDHHLAFPGSISIPEPVFIDTVMAAVRSLAPHGFTTFVLLSAHGGNFAPLEKAATRLREEFAEGGVSIIDFAGREALHRTMAAMIGAGARFGRPQDVDAIHADVTETSVLLARHRDLVHLDRLEVGAMGRIDLDELLTRGLRGITPNGILGDPRGATAEIGEATVEALADAIVPFVEERRKAWQSPEGKRSRSGDPPSIRPSSA
jgi:creatinine amidohydrolase